LFFNELSNEKHLLTFYYSIFVATNQSLSQVLKKAVYRDDRGVGLIYVWKNEDTQTR